MHDLGHQDFLECLSILWHVLKTSCLSDSACSWDQNPFTFKASNTNIIKQKLVKTYYSVMAPWNCICVCSTCHQVYFVHSSVQSWFDQLKHMQPIDCSYIVHFYKKQHNINALYTATYFDLLCKTSVIFPPQPTPSNV